MTQCYVFAREILVPFNKTEENFNKHYNDECDVCKPAVGFTAVWFEHDNDGRVYDDDVS